MRAIASAMDPQRAAADKPVRPARSNRSMTEGWRAGQDRPERLESGENEPACVVGDWDRARCSMLRAGHLAHANGARVTLAHRILPTRDMQMTTWNGR